MKKKKTKSVRLQVRLEEQTVKRIEKAVIKTDADSASEVIRIGTKKYLNELGV